MRKLTESRLPAAASQGHRGAAVAHESAVRQVTGQARYVDDLPEPANLLHAAVALSDVAAGALESLDIGEVATAPGVVATLTLGDVPGHTDIGAVYPGDPILADREILFHGQPLFAVAAESVEQARRATLLAKWNITPGQPILSVDQARAAETYVGDTVHFRQGDALNGLANATHTTSGEIHIGGQEHFYLEGQVSLVIPEEDGGMLVYTSSQHPSEVQKLVAEVLGIPFSRVTVDVRRMGGGFGGKETQAAQWACIAALLANKTGRAVKLRLPRSQDMTTTGKRHPFVNRWTLGYDNTGQIQAADIEVNGLCGYSPDLSNAIVDRAMFHADNGYFLNEAHITGYRCRTHTASNTAFRGFGGPQGMMTIEAAMDGIARNLGEDPLTVRKRNFYGEAGRNVTPYHMTVTDNILPELVSRLEQSADYWARRDAIGQFNARSPIIKKGLALTPVKFGISFTAKHLNQAGALIHLYTDGSVYLNHGGTEMGQGLFTKVAQIVATEFSVPLATIQSSATRTDKVPNTSPTAASSGTDLNGAAAQNAARTLKQRLVEFATDHYKVRPDQIVFDNGQVQIGEHRLTFADLVQTAYMNRISLSATGYYRTPKLHWDAKTGQGRPFLYFAYGASCSEVTIDTLTGEYAVDRVDILHDVGDSLNPAIDIGQIEGGFIQGMGWLTIEELKWNDGGRLLSNNPATYKIPSIGDTPPVFNVTLFDQPNREDTVFKSKAVGEPPLMLPISVWCALRDAIASTADYRINPALNTPATPEQVLFALEHLAEQMQEAS
ncbi:xanthine dehydrogenase molybdopterin binding subunit [Saccharospirillum sp.]|uniref:xanthine dehydrogenase molybdopterin binding subunit n=1 Tax=Saccharospirillum sp. TaxID=2033801 RepID=UPI0034A01508